jgi:type II restriction/modification system DNA methylase subunit YeeA
MTPQTFITKWQASQLKERSASQEHFIDVCRLLGEPTPVEADPDGHTYCFEKGTTKSEGGKGWADVWKRHHFAWEYKGKQKDLTKAFVQLQRYALALENPPLLVVSDMETIQIYTNFTNTVQEIHILSLTDLANPKRWQILKWVFSDPEQLRPGRTRAAVTEEIAQEFAGLAQRFRECGQPPSQVAHFISQLLFGMFAEAAGLFEGQRVLSESLAACLKRPGQCTATLQNLFTTMQRGGLFGTIPIAEFNGGLFAEVAVLPLEKTDIQLLLQVANQDWKDIEPSIFGTLFERGLDPDKRSQLGAHYTDPQSIMRLVQPVVFAPLQAEWQQTKEEIQAVLKKSRAKKSIPKLAQDLFNRFLERLAQVRVLDPACGSGNFLYLVLRGLKDLEHQAILEVEQLALGLGGQFSIHTGPQNVLGMEVNPYAAELARVTVWIGHLQWLLAHGYSIQQQPILQPLNQIDCQDAIMTAAGGEPKWPAADFIVGNPPFLGDKKMISVLGEEYVTRLRRLYQGRVPGGADLVTYWFEKARTQLAKGEAKAVGLVATNSIRGGANRKVLERIREVGPIFEAWSDEAWVNDGAAVRVSLVCFGGKREKIVLNGESVEEIFADLTGAGAMAVDLTTAKPLSENLGISFIGTQKSGAFDLPGEIAREWLEIPNPHGKGNMDVLKPWINGLDITRRYRDFWIIDFGTNMKEEDASLYEVPFEYVSKNVKKAIEDKLLEWKEDNKNPKHLLKQYETWWLLWCSRPEMRDAMNNLSRYISTARVAKYRLFVWSNIHILPDSQIVAIARDDDTTFGILHSRFHEIWSLRLCTWLGKGNDPRYTPTTTFETFPFPEGLTPNILAKDYADHPHAQAIATAAKRLNELRDNWLNPPDWVKRVPEIVPGYPDRLLPVDDHAAEQLKKRTLTNLYNAKPQWLVNAHRQLDEAVAVAYGWKVDLTEEEILKRLLELNLKQV